MTIGERIKQRRQELGLSQQELATRMGYKTPSAICKVETVEQNLTTDRIREFADALYCTESYLMGWSENESVDFEIVTDDPFVIRLQKMSEHQKKHLLKYMDMLLEMESDKDD